MAEAAAKKDNSRSKVITDFMITWKPTGREMITRGDMHFEPDLMLSKECEVVMNEDRLKIMLVLNNNMNTLFFTSFGEDWYRHSVWRTSEVKLEGGDKDKHIDIYKYPPSISAGEVKKTTSKKGRTLLLSWDKGYAFDRLKGKIGEHFARIRKMVAGSGFEVIFP